jgi:protein NUD1
MNAWLDDLSEEWPSQPPSDTVASESRQPGSSISRIPRAAGKPGSQRHTSAAKSNGTVSNPKKGVLQERSLSSENVLASTPVRNSQKRVNETIARRSASDGSSPQVYSTVERRSVTPSPVKPKGDIDETPEWRRRLLMGDMGYGQPKDLFAPTGIQSLFQKPVEQSSEEQKPRNLSFLKHLDAVPSSPPWPLSSMLSGIDNTLDPIAELHTVDEADERSRQTSRKCRTCKFNLT